MRLQPQIMMQYATCIPQFSTTVYSDSAGGNAQEGYALVPCAAAELLPGPFRLLLIIVDDLLYTLRPAEDSCCRAQGSPPVFLMKREPEQRGNPAAFLQMPAPKAVIQYDQLRHKLGESLPVSSGNIKCRHLLQTKVLLLPPLGMGILSHWNYLQGQQIILQKRSKYPQPLLMKTSVLAGRNSNQAFKTPVEIIFITVADSQCDIMQTIIG
ncbi:hypothetical protein D3C75_930470 [compost metagenome]